jgi:hypothetical protein
MDNDNYQAPTEDKPEEIKFPPLDDQQILMA